ncbi:hypothetical protein D7322_12570 [Sphingobacterium puteale]|uniref:Uncharacterized protein n=1 Tax=Sphingobacterium puteale TaxID=2420510 RepID=A0A420VYY8_9SPHI|nr:hypothetical protein [Sphingobacterium puteale]RKO71581.1 hypothetical protein D7322_12570 [Sphingobacterium puteale]
MRTEHSKPQKNNPTEQKKKSEGPDLPVGMTERRRIDRPKNHSKKNMTVEKQPANSGYQGKDKSDV